MLLLEKIVIGLLPIGSDLYINIYIRPKNSKKQQLVLLDILVDKSVNILSFKNLT